MATPALRLLHEQTGKRVPVYFSNSDIATLYSHCRFLAILRSRPRSVPFATTAPPKRRPEESDSEAYCRILANTTGRLPNTYVDKPVSSRLKKKRDVTYVAVFHGSRNGSPCPERKDIGSVTRQHIVHSVLRRGAVPVVLGTAYDFESFWRNVDLSACLNFLGRLSLRDTVSVLAQCDHFVSNDTGLYHVAGALNKPGLVLWYETDMVKNRSTCAKIRHAKGTPDNPSDYIGAIDDFLECLERPGEMTA
jgi:hypothetical protein